MTHWDWLYPLGCMQRPSSLAAVGRQTPGVVGEARTALQVSAHSGVLTALSQAPLGIAIFDREMRYLAASSRFLTEQGLPGDLPLVGRHH